MAPRFLLRPVCIAAIALVASSCEVGNRNPRAPLETIPTPSAMPPAAPTASAAKVSDERFVLAGKSIVDTRQLSIRARPESLLQATIADDLLLFTRGDQLVAEDLTSGATRWSKPAPDGYGAFLVANDTTLFSAGNPDGIAGYSLATGARVFEHMLPKTKGIFASGRAVTGAHGVAFSKGDSIVFFVTNAGETVTLSPPDAPHGIMGDVHTFDVQMKKRGPCVFYFTKENWEAVRCFDESGKAIWQRDFPEGKLWLVASPPGHVVLTSQGHIDDDTRRSLVLSADDGSVELDEARPSGSILEDRTGKLRGLVGWRDGSIVATAVDGSEIFRVTHCRRGLVVAQPAGDDHLLATYEIEPGRDEAQIELFHVDGTGRERWRAGWSVPERLELGGSPLRISSGAGHAVVIAHGRNRNWLDVLSLADGKRLLTVPPTDER